MKDDPRKEDWDLTFDKSVDFQAKMIQDQFGLIIFEKHCKHSVGLKQKIGLVTEPSSARAVYAKVKLAKDSLMLFPVGPNLFVAPKN